MVVNLTNGDESTLNNTNQTYILTPSTSFPNTERINTIPLTFSPVLNRHHKVNFITTCSSDTNGRQVRLIVKILINSDFSYLNNSSRFLNKRL